MNLNLDPAAQQAFAAFVKQAENSSARFSDLLSAHCCKMVLEKYQNALQHMSSEGINKLSNKIYLEMMRLSMEIDKIIYMSERGYD